MVSVVFPASKVSIPVSMRVTFLGLFDGAVSGLGLKKDLGVVPSWLNFEFQNP